MSRKSKMVGLMIAAMCMLTGCSSIELEERNFPLIVTLDKVNGGGYQVELGFEDLAEVADQNAENVESRPVQTIETSWFGAFNQSNANNPKTMDYNHVKAIVMSKAVLDDKDMLREFLDYVEKQDVFARNTLVFSCENQSTEVMSLNGKLELPLGTYLAQLIAGQKIAKDQAAVTVGTLLNESYNKNETLFIPILTVKEEQINIESYYVLSSFQSMGVVEKEIYWEAMLLEGQASEYQFEIDSGEAVVLSKIHVTYDYDETKDGVEVQILVKAEANLQNHTIKDAAMQDEMREQMQEYLDTAISAHAQEILAEKGVDISNSYYRLGTYHRALYEKYQDNMSQYLKNLSYKISFSITPIVD